MSLTVQPSGNATVVTVPWPELDAEHAEAFKDGVAEAVPPSANLVVDLSGVEFVDSSGLSALITCLRRLRTGGGDLRVCGMTRSVRAIFELVRLHRVFHLHETREEAAAAFNRAA